MKYIKEVTSPFRVWWWLYCTLAHAWFNERIADPTIKATRLSHLKNTKQVTSTIFANWGTRLGFSFVV